MKRKFKAGVCQMLVAGQKDDNLAKARSMIREAAANGSEIVVLPEMFNCPYNSRLFPQYAESFPAGKTFKMLSEAAAAEGIYLVGGSLPERENGNIFNTSFVFGPQGEFLAKHQKIHLFDVDLPDGLSFHESKTLARGKVITVVKTAVANLGVAICYDIRFPELSRLMVLMGADMIVLPASFNMNTGPAHWELLLRTRAVDNQVFVIGAATARDTSASYVSYGNSAIVGPWGDIIARADEKETIIYADIDPGEIDKIREALPLLKHRRTDIYHIKSQQ
ncbi:MAG: carbon-nitrogen hydrolase family protein [Peptococcaceae bacterium]|nr:carbon-nitrogen hydrolase family protein [Peptococcaceae bacterium]